MPLTAPRPSAAALATLLAFVAFARAAAQGSPGFFGEYRTREWSQTGFPLDRDSTLAKQTAWTDQRLRLGARLRIGERALITARTDLVDGVFLGDEAMAGARLDARRWDLRAGEGNEGSAPIDEARVYVDWRTSLGVLRIGQQPVDWGLGVFANSGERQDAPFGDPQLGDAADRVTLTFPAARVLGHGKWAGNLTLAAGGGLVWRDEQATLRRGDRAIEAFVAAVHGPTDGEPAPAAKALTAGLYVPVRRQRNDTGDRLDRTVFDGFVHARNRWSGLDATASLASEVVLVTGGRTLKRPAGDEHHTIRAAGGVVRGGLAFPSADTDLEIGYASGDATPADVHETAFVFDGNYLVGLVLYPQILARLSARAAERLDSAGVAWPRRYATDGGVTNAVYIWPRITFRPSAARGLRFTTGILFCVGLQPPVDPADSTASLSYLGGEAASGDMGSEMDAAIDYEAALSGSVRARVGLQYGHYYPGDVLSHTNPGVEIGRVTTVMGRLTLSW